MDAVDYDIIILGSGLAGMRAALSASMASKGKLRIALVSKVHAMRSHTVAAEGGISGVLYEGRANDTSQLHAFDTIKGSDYLADQDAVEMLVRDAPSEIRLLDNLGVPWNRDGDRIALRPFGGMSVPRTAFAADKTGFFMLSAIYDTLLKHENVEVLHERFATRLILHHGAFAGIAAIDLATGEMSLLRSRSCIIATGGASRVYGFTTNSYANTGDGHAMAMRAGLPLKDMEFVQFHPTALVPSGILITEAARGEGAYLLDSKGRRFMKAYAKDRMELAPRDIISKAIITEIRAGRGLREPLTGMKYVELDMRHLKESAIDEKLPMIKEIAKKSLDLDVMESPLPVRPAAHFTMGGIHTDTMGRVIGWSGNPIAGLWAAGEAGCVSVHGANRLGSNSLSQCAIWGKLTGAAAARYAAGKKGRYGISKEANAEEARVNGMLSKNGDNNPYDIRKALWETMDSLVYVYRAPGELAQARKEVQRHFADFRDISVGDKSGTYNTNLRDVLEIESMLHVALAITESAIARKESRGAHARADYPNRDDGNWLKHTLFRTSEGRPELSYAPVRITKWEPKPRTY